MTKLQSAVHLGVLFVLGALILPALAVAGEESHAVDVSGPLWHVDDPKARIEEHDGRKSLFLTSGAAFLEGVSLQDGVIDVDMATTSLPSFVGVIFRAASSGDFEIVYFRPFKSGQPDAVQYTPSFKGSTAWQLFSGDGFTTAVDIAHDRWVHARIEVAGSTLKVYWNDDPKPVLVNTALRRGISGGSIGLWGAANGGHFSNFRYEVRTPQPVRAQPPPTYARGVLTRWELSAAFGAGEHDPERLPDSKALQRMVWRKVSVEPPGMVVVNRYDEAPDRVMPFGNLSQRVGQRPERRVVLARTTIHAGRDGVKRMSIGYSDEVTVFLNGRPLYTGRSAYRYRDPSFLGIMDVENDAVYLPLKKGANELVLSVAEYFGGWGFICRIDDPRGVRE